MKISINTLRALNERHNCAEGVTSLGVDELVAKINAQLGGVEETIDIGRIYKGIVIAKVVSCEKHPNADRLNVCQLDDGGITPDVKRDEQGYVQVVCGAPNVRAGLTVAWLPPGATVPETADKDPFVLEARELRGVVSNGMLASPKELALGDSHAGILEIDGDHAAGTDFATAFNLVDDVVIDIENKMFTHRPDCFGWLGVDRELAGIQGKAFTSPDWYTPQALVPAVETEELPLKVVNELPEIVPRFTAITLRDVQVKPSPVWLQVELAKVGLRPINNIVDYTNYFMLLTGQPLHAYDYDKVAALSGETATIVVRHPLTDESVALLNGKTVTPRPEAIMIATDKQVIGVGGVMGGSETEVDDTTTNLIIECANFDMYSIRRTSMANGLFTDAVTRFNKGQSPLQTQAVLAKIVDEIRQYAGGKVASQLIDVYDCDKLNVQTGDNGADVAVTVTPQFINSRLGLNLTADQIITLLENVEFGKDVKGDEITFYPPFWRTDIERREDIVEEVGRLYGFDKLSVALPRRDLTPAEQDEMLGLKTVLRTRLAAAGANELLTYSFVHGDLLQKVGQDKAQAYSLSNALSPDLQYYRLSLTPSLLDKVHSNLKAGYSNFAIFEIGKAHILGREADGVPVEFERLALVLAANQKAASEYSGAPYYQARAYLDAVLEQLGLKELTRFEPLTEADEKAATAYFEKGRAATIYIGDTHIGRIGEYTASVRKALKLPDFSAGFELGLKPLLELKGAKEYITLPRFPKLSQDITFKVAADLAYQDLFGFIEAEIMTRRIEQSLPSVSVIDIFQKDDETDFKQITFRVSIASYERTLTDTEVSQLLTDVAHAAREKFSAEQI